MPPRGNSSRPRPGSHPLRAQQGRPSSEEAPKSLEGARPAQLRDTLLAMRGTTLAVLGVFAFLIAGFIRGGLEHSSDPELVFAFSWGLAAFGLFSIIAGGIATGIRLARQ